MKNYTLSTLIIISFIFNATSQSGSLDSGFATEGIYTSQIDTTADEAKAFAFQDDGKIITVGYIGPFASEDPTGEDFYIRRFNADGSPDFSFGNNGIVIQDVSGGTDAAWDVEVLSDGKILAAGFGWQSWERAVVMRFNADGSLDDTFWGNGISVIEIGGFIDRLWDIEIQDDGKIVGCGTCFVSGSTNDWCAVRLHPNGNLDISFGDNGVLTLDLGNTQVSAHDLEVLDDGRILMAGYGKPEGTYLMQFAMLTGNGQLDESWDEDGLVEVSIGTIDDALNAVAVQEDGKIVGAGYSHNGENYDFALVRLNSDGSLDESFGNGGMVQTPIGTWDDFCNSLYIRSDGRIIVAGNAAMDGSWMDFAIAMYNSDGSLENNFGTNGVVTTELSTNEDLIFQIKPDSNGDIIAAGTTKRETSGEEVFELALVKYLAQLELGVIDNGIEGKLLVYPNPIASLATLRFELTKSAKWSVELYDLKGRHLEQLLSESDYNIGENEIEFTIPEYLENGNYLVKLQSKAESFGVMILKR